MILIAAPELIPALRDRVGADDEVLTFADSEPVRAYEAIRAQKPPVIALERLFAASPRGAALIARIKADPALDATEIRVVSHDSNYSRVSPRRKPARGASGYVATRRATRYRMGESVGVTVEETPGRLIDLSELGAQVISAVALKPQQPVRLGFTRDGGDALQVEGLVAWARLEITRLGPTYRAGVEFVNQDRERLAAFCEAHQVHRPQ